MKKLWRNIRGWVIAIAVLGGGYALLHFVLLAPQPIPVRVHRVGRGTVEWTVSNTKAGSVRARLSSELSVESAGRVVETFPGEGKHVKKDDPILRLDDKTAKAYLLVVEKELKSAVALKAQAKASADDAVREYERLKGVAERVSESQLDGAQTQVETTKAALQSAEARVEQQQARKAQAELAVEKLTLRAPFDGVVAEFYVEVGEWAVPGKPLVKLIDLDRLYVSAELDEVDIGHLREGLEVRMKLDPFKDRIFGGKITRISRYVSEALEQNRTVEIEVDFAEETDVSDLRPGTSADVEVILKMTGTDTLRIPTLAIMEGNRVLVVDGETARAVEIETGLKNWDYTEVTSGIDEGTPVITSLDREEVREGAQVVIEEDSAESSP